MKMVSAVIKHFRLDEVRAALTEIGVTGMVAGLGTITPASGFVGPAGPWLSGSLPVWPMPFHFLAFVRLTYLKRVKKHKRAEDTVVARLVRSVHSQIPEQNCE